MGISYFKPLPMEYVHLKMYWFIFYLYIPEFNNLQMLTAYYGEVYNLSTSVILLIQWTITALFDIM